jgi:hypothetical protein
MSRIKSPTIGEAPAASQPILENVRRALGFVQNVQRLMPISPPALEGWFPRACQDLGNGNRGLSCSPRADKGLLELSARAPGGPFYSRKMRHEPSDS